MPGSRGKPSPQKPHELADLRADWLVDFREYLADEDRCGRSLVANTIQNHTTTACRLILGVLSNNTSKPFPSNRDELMGLKGLLRSVLPPLSRNLLDGSCT